MSFQRSNALFDLNTTDIQIVVRDLNATIVKIPKADYVRQLIDAVRAHRTRPCCSCLRAGTRCPRALLTHSFWCGPTHHQVFKLADLLPCVDEVIPSILAVDEKLLQLPEFVQDIKNLTETAKEAIDTARNLVRPGAVVCASSTDRADPTPARHRVAPRPTRSSSSWRWLTRRKTGLT